MEITERTKDGGTTNSSTNNGTQALFYTGAILWLDLINFLRRANRQLKI